jgi:hypothetical protein
MTRISVSQDTRKLWVALKSRGERYDEVIRGLIVSHGNLLTTAELSRRIREGKPHPMGRLISRSRP